MQPIVELDPIGYHRILHAVFRANESEAEVTRASDVLRWVGTHISLINQIMADTQARLFGLIFNHWLVRGTPTNRVMAEELALAEDMPDGMCALLEEYDALLPSLKKVAALDMPQVVDDRVKDWERVRMLIALAEAQQITLGAKGIDAKDSKKPGEKRKKGARDAAAYLFGELHKGVIVVENEASGGSAKEDMPTIITEFEKNKYANMSGKLQIKTGLSGLDRVIHGLRRGEFVGVMGFAGQFKTTLCRTFLYNAAMQGLRCLHIPLESSYKEELMLYGIMHSHDRKFYRLPGGEHAIDRQSFDDGTLSKQEEQFLDDEVIPDFQKNMRGDVIIRQPGNQTWGDIKQIIELEDREAPLDLVLIDYLALVDVADSRNSMTAVTEIIKQAKRLTLTFRGGLGLTLITPVQGKREGYEDAKKNDGVWRADAAYMYSEFEKSLDKMLYVFTDDDMTAFGTLKVGACKSRRSVNAPPTTVERHPLSGRISDFVEQSESTNKSAPSMESVREDGF